MGNSTAEKATIIAGEAVSEGTGLVFVSNAILNFFAVSGLSFMWGMFNGLQFMTHFPLIAVHTPANAAIMLEYVL